MSVLIGRKGSRADRGTRSPWLQRGASLAALAGLLVVSGCIADGPGGSPLGVAFAGKEDASAPQDGDDDGQAIAAVAVSSKGVEKADRAIARREAAQMAETGTISGSAAIDRMIVAHAEENGIPPALAFAVVRVESRYNPRARGRGVYGLSQIKPATARSLGFSGSASDLLDADTNLTYGMKYLKGAWEQSGHDVCGTAMKYKGGHRTTRMTAAARSYCSKVKAHMAELDLSRRAPGRAVPATIETAKLETRRSAEPRREASDAIVEAVAFAPQRADRPTPGDAVPKTMREMAAKSEAAAARGGRVAGAKTTPEAETDAETARDANLAARFGDDDASVPAPALRPSVAD
ncbi:lytic transglycosylase domain-containing protein [Jiella avicenniae]|uniref:Transglycosylase SLT domain-containing protein n=1 Tax=Jiella avicenniae TaxID=2907202 RepID=A0A9X1P3L0_9HYPH|nr:transglycosylase SLT domain-containing protein [Jiella avicenniae]MCE7029858.1 transglycosylase SLT domain-containing protein [Jiella avicenniae]